MNPNMPSSGRVDVLLSALGDGRFDAPARINDVINSLKFDETLNSNKPERCTLDFPHAIEILEAQVAALVEARGVAVELIEKGSKVVATRDAYRNAGSGKHADRVSAHIAAVDDFCTALAALTEPQS